VPQSLESWGVCCPISIRAVAAALHLLLVLLLLMLRLGLYLIPSLFLPVPCSLYALLPNVICTCIPRHADLLHLSPPHRPPMWRG
jgi:hypothetical protein